MADGKDYVKYVTQEVIRYIDTPREVRRKHRLEKKALKQPWLVRWFGVAPMGIQLWWRSRGRKASLERELQANKPVSKASD